MRPGPFPAANITSPRARGRTGAGSSPARLPATCPPQPIYVARPVAGGTGRKECLGQRQGRKMPQNKADRGSGICRAKSHKKPGEHVFPDRALGLTEHLAKTTRGYLPVAASHEGHDKRLFTTSRPGTNSRKGRTSGYLPAPSQRPGQGTGPQAISCQLAANRRRSAWGAAQASKQAWAEA